MTLFLVFLQTSDELLGLVLGGGHHNVNTLTGDRIDLPIFVGGLTQDCAPELSQKVQVSAYNTLGAYVQYRHLCLFFSFFIQLIINVTTCMCVPAWQLKNYFKMTIYTCMHFCLLFIVIPSPSLL